jgi:osmotically-inducible protein OsmY
MKNSIVLAITLLLLCGTTTASYAGEEATVDQKLSETTSKIDTERQGGRLSVKQASDLKTEGQKLSADIDKCKAKTKGAMSDADKTKFCNKVKALDEKVSRAAFPNRTSDEKSLATIRKAIMKTRGLSSEAQNVKLSFENGILVLDGPVKTEKEKEELVNIAKSAGASQVSCKLSVTQ